MPSLKPFLLQGLLFIPSLMEDSKISFSHIFIALNGHFNDAAQPTLDKGVNKVTRVMMQADF